MSKLSIDDLAPAPYNPREITDDAADGLRASVARFGDIGGITYNERTGRLVCGHQRVKQLRALGAQMVDGALQLASGHRFPVRVVDWSEAEEKAANVEANNPHIAGTFNADLEGLLGELRGSMGELEFGELRLDELLSEQPDATGDVEQDEVPEPPAEPVCKAGDVWVLGDHLLVCGDCLTTIKHAAVRVCLTDPPYSVNYDRSRSGRGGDIAAHAPYREEGGTDESAADVLRFLSECQADVVVMSYPVDQHFFALASALRVAKFELKKELVWVKDRFSLWAQSTYKQQHEPILVCVRKGKPLRANTPSNASTVLQFPKPTAHKLHPTEKPMDLWAKLLEWHTVARDCVLDPFAGSGTTLIAAEQLGRKCHAIEIEPRYCDVIIERWQQLSGGKAQRKAG